MKLYYDVTEAVQAYLITRDTAHLEHAKDLLQAEIDTPELQEATLTLDHMSAKQAEAKIAKDGFLRISLDEITNDADVETDKYIRVFEALEEGEEEETRTASIVLKVAMISPSHMLLLPYSPASIVEGSAGDGTDN